MEQRPSNPTCIAPERQQVTDFTQVRVFPNLTFSTPLAMMQAPNDSSHWYVVEQTGKVWRFENSPDVASAAVAIDVGDRIDSVASGIEAERELGLLGMAFHPQFATNHFVYLLYSRKGTSPRETWISRFTASADGSTFVPDSEVVLMQVRKPSNYHNGGTMHFGSDGYLYIGLGDGGKANDPGNNAQNPNTVLGKMIRIDVDHGNPYAIPAGNPNYGNALCNLTGKGAAACPEIYASGFRNPWQWSFDSDVPAESPRWLWMGDVGQDRYEEIDLVERGKNYGWSCREGLHAVDINADRCANVDLTQYASPIYEYSHSVGDSINGGYVYRGAAMPDLVGRYIFGDYVRGYIWYLTEDAKGFHRNGPVETNALISAFAQGNDKEIYFVNYGTGEPGTGQLFTLRPAVPTSAAGVPENLSQTGCFDPADPRKPSAGLIPYQPAAPFFSDGASKERWIALPDGDTVNVSNDGDFEFPSRTVLAKNFSLNGQLVETRLFMRHPDGIWAGYTYEWNDAQTDATLVDVNGKQRTINGQVWSYPSRGECMRCHTNAAGFTLGPEAAQLDNDYGYPSGNTANQMATLKHIGIFKDDPPAVTSLVDPFGSGTVESIPARARSYLHTNCSGCHRPNGPTQSDMDLRATTQLADMHVCNTDPHAGDLGITGGKLVVPGNPEGSILFSRLSRTDAYKMPPLGRSTVDEDGAALIRAWIAGLTTCP
jgi:uncharacterized repeat protein (TIGR03806 family)